MLGRFKFLLIYFLYWVLFFELARLAFILYYFSHASKLPFASNALSFVYGLRMDISMAAYLLVPVCLFVLASVFLPFFRKQTIYKIYTYLVLFFVLLISITDLEVYGNWGFRMDATPLRYLSSPKEAWASISQLPLVLIFLAFILVFIAFCFSFKLTLKKILPFLNHATNRFATALLILLFTALLIVPIRGGLQLSPINQSSVYFSKNNFANITAINATWNFVYDVLNEPSSSKNPYDYLDQKKAREIVDSLYKSSGTTEQVLKTKNPNVLLIIWESFTEKATHARIDGTEVTPQFNALKSEGIYFSRMYASGDRTDKGIAAVLSGYPALNNSSIIRLPGKSAKLNSLSGLFKDKGYRTSFYYGGEPEFANIKSFVLQSHYDDLIEKSDFSARDLNSKWGAHDGVVAAKLLQDLKKENRPFFTTWLTLSSHEPFETPVPTVIHGGSVTSLFANSLHYTDKVIYSLVQELKQEPWWNNTLVIIVADHGHPLLDPSTNLENHKIPMLWLGGALNKTGIVIDKVCSQLDIATTLARQDGNKENKFSFSKDIFDSTAKSWAFYAFNDGFGFVQPDKAFIFDNVGRRLISQMGTLSPKDLEAGKAMQQISFGDYLKK